jgi:hypothetical protein
MDGEENTNDIVVGEEMEKENNITVDVVNGC